MIVIIQDGLKKIKLNVKNVVKLLSIIHLEKEFIVVVDVQD